MGIDYCYLSPQSRIKIDPLEMVAFAGVDKQVTPLSSSDTHLNLIIIIEYART